MAFRLSTVTPIVGRTVHRDFFPTRFIANRLVLRSLPVPLANLVQWPRIPSLHTSGTITPVGSTACSRYPLTSPPIRQGTTPAYRSAAFAHEPVVLIGASHFTRANRVINPTPLRPDKPLEWEVRPNTPVLDGAGVQIGTVAASLKVDNRSVPTSKFNFGMSKVLAGRLCLYAFSIPVEPTLDLRKSIDPKELINGAVGTSAWLPLDQVVDQDTLIDRIGLGKPTLPRLPLEDRRYRVTGGDPHAYDTPDGELAIVKALNGPVPSHYLRRPSGTVNLLYSVPGFGLGGQSLDSFLASDNLTFRPAKGAKQFTQPTYYPKSHPQAGQVSPKTMTFLYGALEPQNQPPIYGWIAQESLAD